MEFKKYVFVPFIICASLMLVQYSDKFRVFAHGQEIEESMSFAALGPDLQLERKSLTNRVRGEVRIDKSINNINFICDSTTKFIVSGKGVIIENCVFNANGNSVEGSLIDCFGEEIVFKNCIIKNIKGKEGMGAYGLYVDIERCSASIYNCKFQNISDSRDEDDPVGQLKGMCGAIYYSCSKNYLKTIPQCQYVENVEIENVYTSLPNGEINIKSTDADGVRIFINERKSHKAFLDAQEYVIKCVTGRDVQKRLIKISGAANCQISNVIYKRNRKLTGRYPANLIAVYDSDNISISDVDYSSGCNDIAICGSNSMNIAVDGLKVDDNENLFRKSSSSLFRISNCTGLSIKGLVFSGNYFRLGQINNSENVEIDLEGKNVSCASPFEIKDTKNIILNGSLKTVKRRKSSLFMFINVEGLSIDERLGDVSNNQIFEMKNCSNVSVNRKYGHGH